MRDGHYLLLFLRLKASMYGRMHVLAGLASAVRQTAVIRALGRVALGAQRFIRPPDLVCGRTYILPVFLLSFFLFAPPNLRGR